MIKKMTVEDFSNLGELRLHNIDKIDNLILKNASLGKAELMNIDATSSFKIGSFISRLIIDCIIVSLINAYKAVLIEAIVFFRI